MSLFVVDVEADGQIPNKYSMVCFGAVKVDDNLDQTFYGKTAPISDIYNPEALGISGFSREEHLTFDDPKEVMIKFKNWILSVNKSGSPIFISDNIAFDFQWINYYFHYYLSENPFGYSGRRIGDLYCGFMNDFYYRWKKHRDNEKYPHNHDPVSDALGNASALLYLKSKGLNIKLK